MPTMIDTPTYRYADLVLRGRLRSQLRQWDRKGWAGEKMARELYAKTGGEIDVTGQTIRMWLRQLGIRQIGPVE